MKKLLYTCIVLIIIIGAWYFYTGQASPKTLNADVYPLYSGATWGAEQATQVNGVAAFQTLSTPVTNVTDISAQSQPFTKYYADKLTSLGWARDDAWEAGGPGAEVTFYTKGDQFIEIAFHSVFHTTSADAPSQCPCDVQLQIASGSNLPPSPSGVAATHTYTDPTLGFSIILPTELASSSNSTLWSVDPSYVDTALGPNKPIPGVKFTIPSSIAAGTNLSNDSYISVEHQDIQSCTASPFMFDPSVKSQSLQEGAVSYSVASTSDAAVGNRYEETVYARTGTSPCIAVRYFIHYGAIENFPAGQVKEFDKAALLATFDQIRRTLAIPQQ